MTLGEQLRARVKEARNAYEQGLTERQRKERSHAEVQAFRRSINSKLDSILF